MKRMKLISAVVAVLMVFSAILSPMKADEKKSMSMIVVRSNDLSPRVQTGIIVTCYDKKSGAFVVGAKITVQGCGVDISISTGVEGFVKFNVIPTETGSIKVEADARHLGYDNIEKTTLTVTRITYPPTLVLDPCPSAVTSERFMISGTAEPGCEVRSSLANTEFLDKYNYGSFGRVATVGTGPFKLEVRFPDKAGKYIINITAKREGKTTTKQAVINYTPTGKKYRKVVMKVDSFEMIVNGEVVKLGNPPVKSSPPLPADLNGNTFVQCQSLVNAVNASVSWDQNERKIVITRRLRNDVSVQIKLSPGSKLASRNGISENFDEAKKLYPVIISGKSYCPLRYIIEALFGKLTYDSKTGNINITIEE